MGRQIIHSGSEGKIRILMAFKRIFKISNRIEGIYSSSCLDGRPTDACAPSCLPRLLRYRRQLGASPWAHCHRDGYTFHML
jgi:hypothetical protein